MGGSPCERCFTCVPGLTPSEKSVIVGVACSSDTPKRLRGMKEFGKPVEQAT